MSKLSTLFKKIKTIFKDIGLYRLIAVPVVFVIFFLLSISDRSINEKNIKTGATLRQTSTLYTTEYARDMITDKYCSIALSSADAGSPVMILESPDAYGIKVQLEDGRTGWVKEKTLNLSKKPMSVINAQAIIGIFQKQEVSVNVMWSMK